MEILDFSQIIKNICSKETSFDPSHWTPENPTWGHCAIVSLLAQEMFGGTLLRVSLVGTEFEAMGSHYFNKLPDGTIMDFTEDQFNGQLPNDLPIEGRTREKLLANSDTAKRYEILKVKFNELSK